MILTLELPEELESALIHEANQVGLSLSEYTLQVLLSRPLLSSAPKNGTELVTYWQNAGVIGMRSDITDSQQHARNLRGQVERRPPHKEP